MHEEKKKNLYLVLIHELKQICVGTININIQCTRVMVLLPRFISSILVFL